MPAPRLDVAPLISGVSGALHESFPTREEATFVFMQQRDKGNIKLIDGSPSSFPSPGPTELWEPLTPRSSPRISPRHQNRIYTTRQSRPPSPPVIHPNVSYTRGHSSSPNVSPRATRHVSPRAVVQTPALIKPYPSDSDDSFLLNRKNSPASHSQRSVSSPTSTKSRSVVGLLSSPTPRTVIKTPSDIESYPNTIQSSTSSSKSDKRLPPLSPFNSPRSYTPKDLPQGSAGRTSSKYTMPRTQSAQVFRPPSASSGSLFGDPTPPTWPAALSTMTGHANDCNQCQHICPNCKHSSSYFTDAMVPLRPTSSTHAPDDLHWSSYDPRSPMSQKDKLAPGLVKLI